MGPLEGSTLYVCPRCLESRTVAGACPRCGVQRVRCHPGDPDDPCRRPLMDAQGKVLTRAPLWWLRHTVSRLARRWEEE